MSTPTNINITSINVSSTAFDPTTPNPLDHQLDTAGKIQERLNDYVKLTSSSSQSITGGLSLDTLTMSDGETPTAGTTSIDTIKKPTDTTTYTDNSIIYTKGAIDEIVDNISTAQGNYYKKDSTTAQVINGAGTTTYDTTAGKITFQNTAGVEFLTGFYLPVNQ